MSVPLRLQLQGRLEEAARHAGLDPARATVSPASDPRFGDYQSNLAMVLAKELKSNPRDICSRLIDHLDLGGLADPPEVAGAGFLNFRITRPALEQALGRAIHDERLGCAPSPHPRTIVLDFSSPNVAKPMHVGHIRSTILGDCLAKVARFLGHKVITDNHLGDWGTQFGKVIYGWKHFRDDKALASHPVGELVRLYRHVNQLEEDDPAVAAEVRMELVRLQQGDAENHRIWSECVRLSWSAFSRLYDLLGVSFDEHLGESAYNDALGPLCRRLEAEGIARISDGALCLFFPDHPRLADKPALIRKADGGFLYATTDLATIEYRVKRWNPDEIWYVVGTPQQLHFDQIFEASRRMGLPPVLHHIAFGSILGEDRKMMKTRSGDNVGLAEVLDEALERASRIISEKNPALDPSERARIAKAVGIGAVKYAELSQNRLTDYVFSWDKLLAFHGNTAPYLQNAYVRIRSIFRKAGERSPCPELRIAHPAERALGMRLARYPEVVPVVLDDFRPNLLAHFLFELAEDFHSFYEACPVIHAGPEARESRLALCDLTARTLHHGLGLMGIDCPERM